MVVPVRGAVVVVRFPFSDLSGTKLRPAVVLSGTERDDWILCQVTSNPYGDSGAIPIMSGDFAAGFLRLTSFARPAKLFTADQGLFASSVGLLKADVSTRIIESVVKVLRGTA